MQVLRLGNKVANSIRIQNRDSLCSLLNLMNREKYYLEVSNDKLFQDLFYWYLKHQYKQNNNIKNNYTRIKIISSRY